MSNNQKYIALPGGETCKPKSPHTCYEISTYRCYELPDCPLCKGCIADIEFDKTAPTIPITEVMSEGEVFSGTVIKWYQIANDETWYRVENRWQEDYIITHNCPIRIAIKPLKAKEPVKEQGGIAKHDTPTDIVENKETVYGPGNDNYGRDKKPWKKVSAVDELNLDERASNYADSFHAETHEVNSILFNSYKQGWNDSTQHRHASFVALVEGEIAKYIKLSGDYNNSRYSQISEVLTDLLNKIK